MGHKSLQRVYDKPDEEELLEEYLKAIDLLTINDENRLKAKVATLEEDKDRMIQELTRTVEDMQAQLQPKDNQLQELRNEIKVLREKKDQEIHVLREQMNKLNVAMDNLVNGFKTYKKEVQLYREQYGGRHLTKEELEKVEQMFEWSRTHPNTDDT